MRLNGLDLVASEEDQILTVQQVAASVIGELDLASWIEVNLRSTR